MAGEFAGMGVREGEVAAGEAGCGGDGGGLTGWGGLGFGFCGHYGGEVWAGGFWDWRRGFGFGGGMVWKWRGKTRMSTVIARWKVVGFGESLRQTLSSWYRRLVYRW